MDTCPGQEFIVIICTADGEACVDYRQWVRTENLPVCSSPPEGAVMGWFTNCSLLFCNFNMFNAGIPAVSLTFSLKMLTKRQW